MNHTRIMPWPRAVRRACVPLAGALVFAVAGPGVAQEPPATGVPRAYTLDDLREHGVRHSERMAESAAGTLEAKAQRDEAFAYYYYPHIEGGVFLSGPVPEARGDATQVTEASELGNLKFGELGYAVRLDSLGVYPLYTFGKLTFLKEAAERGLRAALANERRARNDLIHDIDRAYWTVVLARSLKEIVDEGVKQLDSAQEKLQQMLDDGGGTVSQIDLNKLDYFRAEVVSRQAEAAQGTAVAERALRLLAGLPDADPLPLADTAVDRAPPPRPVGDYTGLYERFRPELEALREAEMALDKAAKAREMGFYPDFVILARARYSYSNVTDDQKNPFVRDDYNFSEGFIAVGLRFDLDIALKMSQRDQANARLARMAAQRRYAGRGMRLELSKAYADLVTALETANAYETGRKSARKWLVRESLNYGVGMTETRDLLEALAAYFQARLRYVKACYDTRIAQAALHRAAGIPDLERRGPADEVWRGGATRP